MYVRTVFTSISDVHLHRLLASITCHDGLYLQYKSLFILDLLTEQWTGTNRNLELLWKVWLWITACSVYKILMHLFGINRNVLLTCILKSVKSRWKCVILKLLIHYYIFCNCVSQLFCEISGDFTKINFTNTDL